MKALLKLFVFASIIVLIANSCQKELSNDDLTSTNYNEAFNVFLVKNWYNTTFTKTAEYKNVVEKDKRTPDWNNGIYIKMGTIERIEFPLIKAKKQLPILSNKLSFKEIGTL